MTTDLDLKTTLSTRRIVGLWRMITGYRAIYAGAFLCIGLAAVCQTVFYFLLRYFTDDVLGVEAMRGQLAWVAAGFIGLALAQGLFTFMGGRWATMTSENVIRRLRDYLYDHVQRLTFAYHDKTPTGDLIQRSTSDVETMRRFLGEESVGLGRILSLFVVNFVGLLTLNPRLALISIVVVPLIVAVSIYFFRMIGKRYEIFQEEEAKLSTTLQENLSGVRVVRAFARQDFERQKFEVTNRGRYDSGRKLLVLHAVYWPSTDIIVGIQLIIGYAVGATMAINGEITVGTFLAYMGMLTWIMWPIRNVGRLIVQMSMALVSFDRVAEIIRVDREPLDAGTHRPDGPPHGEIVFDDVRFAYAEEMAVLNGITFRAEPGQVIALVGPTGSGKTSLVNLLPRFYEYQGSIRLDGVELRDYPRRYLREQIGFVLQEPFLFSRTIKENIMYGVHREVTDEDVYRAAQAAAVHDVILSFPDGYDTVVGERGVTLSGGQKQRVTLARTLLKDPAILILDDATSSVDTETEAAIREALQELIPGRTTFIIAHRVQTVMSADLILVLEKGRIVQSGTHAELLEQEGIYRRIYELQSQIEDELQQDLAAAHAAAGSNGHYRTPERQSADTAALD
ncbi:MAG: ABC transporter ATP-binding protein/permease [Candidatus Promineofilum sp.]|nr:ABC transporter ATP-binding protein/permease [Promineifilum sp.]